MNTNTTLDIDSLVDSAISTEEPETLVLQDGSQVDPETGEVSEPAGSLATLEGCTAKLASLMGPLPTVRPGEYPYHGKKHIKAVLSSNPEAAICAFVCMYHLQTQYEQATDSTKDKNRRGLMSSHAGANGKHGYVKDIISQGMDALDPEGQERVVRWGAMYTKQTAALLRHWAERDNPELAVSARTFFGG